MDIQFPVTINVPKMIGNDKLEALQQIVAYIIEEDLPLDIIGPFVFALNWDEETLTMAKAAAQEMLEEKNRYLQQRPETVQATEKSELHQTVEGFIRSASSNPYYEVSEESQLIDDLRQTGKALKIQMDLLADKQTKKSQGDRLNVR